MPNGQGYGILDPTRYSSKQRGATTGKQVPFDYAEFTRGAAEYQPQIARAANEAAALEEQKRRADEEYRFNKRQSIIGTGIQGINTGITAYPHVKALAQKYGPRIADVFTPDDYLSNPIVPKGSPLNVIGGQTPVQSGPLNKFASQTPQPAPISGPGAGLPGQDQILSANNYIPGNQPINTVAQGSALSQPGQVGPGNYENIAPQRASLNAPVGNVTPQGQYGQGAQGIRDFQVPNAQSAPQLGYDPETYNRLSTVMPGDPEMAVDHAQNAYAKGLVPDDFSPNTTPTSPLENARKSMFETGSEIGDKIDALDPALKTGTDIAGTAAEKGVGVLDKAKAGYNKVAGSAAGKVAGTALSAVGAASTGLNVGKAFGAKNKGKDAVTEAGKIGLSGGAAAAQAMLFGANPLLGLAFGGLAGSSFGQKVIGKNCIMVTACHGADSEEVNITRKFRDAHMSAEQIRGYYVIADRIVPAMEENKVFHANVKRDIVDPLIEYGRWALGMTPLVPSAESKRITTAFLASCAETGQELSSYVRSNGEVV